MKSIILLVVAVISLASHTATAFTVRPLLPCRSSRSSLLLAKRKNGTRAKGFGKIQETAVESQQQQQPSESSINNPSSNPTQPTLQQQPLVGLQSMSPENPSTSPKPPSLDSNLTPEERAKRILKEKYGLKTLQEQQLETKQAELRDASSRKQAQWNTSQKQDNFDLLMALPAPVTVAIDRFLKAGVVVCGTLFVLAGLGITLEAWSKASNQPLPANVDAFIVNSIEPYFTPGLFVLLAFSVSLGGFAALQLGSAGATYKEE
jgi:hypothetical protein